MLRSRFTRNFFKHHEKMLRDFQREFDEMLPPQDFELGINRYFPLTFNDDFFFPIK